MKPSLRELLSKPTPEIVDFLGTIYEHSPWVAEGLVAQPEETWASITSITLLAAAMKRIVDQASDVVKLQLLRSHPDLCEKVATLETLTAESQEEQSRSGLQALTNEELEQFTKFNTEYREKFGFPFILAVRNATKYTVLAGLKGRVANPVEVEFVTALQQVHKIAWMRLLAKIDTSDAKGFLTCHVLDTANGCPGLCSRVSYFVLVSNSELIKISFFHYLNL
jgi:2-oxo-4-hydroxy-4-carboxy-5-ureidoimidazoline decarboxylase